MKGANEISQRLWRETYLNPEPMESVLSVFIDRVDQWFCVFVRWEYDESYCEAVKKMPPYDAGPRLLDVIDTAIFDYLIGNADRHHYESFQDDGGASMLILLDNGKR